MQSFALAALATAAASLSRETEAPARVIPDRVSIERTSVHFWEGYKKLGVKIDGVIRRQDVVEFCASEGWAMVQVRNSMGVRIPDPATNGRTFLLERVQGKIEPYWIAKDHVAAKPDAASALAAAELKRQRKAEKMRQLAEKGAIARD